jgi:hypothetical protein
MKDSKDYFVANIVTNEAMQCNGYMDFLRRNMKEQILNGILAIVSDGNEYAIKLLPEQRIEKTDMMSVEVRQGISVKELVRCGECKHHTAYRCINDMALWKHMCGLGHGTIGDDWFCADGERRSDG